ncbi:homologous-pairing protein 2 homolog [Bicyclus anynana]|uniref:Homologous-pairing protein 2 homolog n=1 Tax=Bicyclus anynana TaxID=110368 RepID=A0ABM3LZM7_BICAN|nr:homologous-pairing protein 2 homolog [Bicyclus anynana]
MASDSVLKYLIDTNRPYSCADVTVNLRGAYTKGAVQKALDALSESGKIKCKLYGKQKVYAALQLENVQENTDTEDYDAQISSLSNILNDKNADLKKAEANIKNLTSAPTNDMTKSESAKIKDNIDKLEKKLNVLRDTTEVLSADEKKIILSEHEKYLKEYRKRKRICSDMLEAVLEGYPKSKKNFLEELCIETDEMVNFQLKTT